MAFPGKIFSTFVLLTFLTLGLIGYGTLGDFDAANQDDPVLSNRIWRAYSAVDRSTIWPNNLLVSTTTAYSDNNGSTFTDLEVVNPAIDLNTPGLSWVNEVPTIVYDPADPNTDAHWKLIWERHLLNESTRDFTHSWLGIKAAGLPIGPWSSEFKLLAGTWYDPNDALNPEPRTPLIYPLPPQLSDCWVFTEPGTMIVTDGFYLTMHCATSPSISGTRIPLLKFLYPLAGNTFEINGTLLGPNDAILFANKYRYQYPELSQIVAFSAPSMFQKNGYTYLIATPVDINAKYLGCAVFKIADLNTAEVQRLPNGIPKMLKYIRGITGTHRGACTYSEASTASGIVLSQLLTSSAQPFTLVNTGIQIP